MLVEMRHPSPSGLAPSGKDLGVLYLHSKDCTDTLFNNRVADALACRLEEDYFAGQAAVKLFSMEKESGRYDSVDSMALLSMDLETDVLFVLDAPRFTNSDKKPRVLSAVYAYDTMGKDSVYKVTTRLEVNNAGDQDADSLLMNSTELAFALGNRISEHFSSRWVKEFYTLYYFDVEKSLEAVSLAENMRWEDAMRLWLELVTTKNPLSRGHYEYNLSTACYMLGEYSLALEWLDRAEADAEIKNIAALRKRILSRMDVR